MNYLVVARVRAGYKVISKLVVCVDFGICNGNSSIFSIRFSPAITFTYLRCLGLQFIAFIIFFYVHINLQVAVLTAVCGMFLMKYHFNKTAREHAKIS